ncbi:MAG: flagellar assembly protein H, partial [Phormidesmis sp. CAN_BIN44]|nr:flagellar assembly protein H [Phormidesmis sp. CAN_BIN44]
MAQNSLDQLSKQYLEEFLTPIAAVQRQYEIPGEAKFVDVWFVPDSEVTQTEDLGLLGRIVQTPCLLEPYRNLPTRTEVRVAVMKLIWIQEDERRKTQQDALSQLWILAATTSKPLLEESGGIIKSDWMTGVYFIPDIFKTAFTPSGNCEATVAIDQLPETEETLWLRILGRDATQERAIREVLTLPIEHPRRSGILRLLASWKVRIDLGGIEDFSGREAIMALSEAFLEWEQATQQRAEAQGLEQGQRSLILRQLEQRIG